MAATLYKQNISIHQIEGGKISSGEEEKKKKNKQQTKHLMDDGVLTDHHVSGFSY